MQTPDATVTTKEKNGGPCLEVAVEFPAHLHTAMHASATWQEPGDVAAAASVVATLHLARPIAPAKLVAREDKVTVKVTKREESKIQVWRRRHAVLVLSPTMDAPPPTTTTSWRPVSARRN